MKPDRDSEPLNTTAVLVLILGAYMMLVLDLSIVVTALPKIHHALGFSTPGLAWVQDAYALAFGGLLLLGARSGDVLGRRRMFIVGIAVFSLASLLVGLAQDAAWLVAARVLQGAGAAIAAPSTLALLAASFPQGPARTRATAYYGAVAGGATAVGLVLGGALTSWVSWRAGLLINVPIGIGMIVAAPRYLVETPRRSGRFDLAGAVTGTAGMAVLVFGIIHAAATAWANTVTIASLAAGVVLLAVFVLVERRAEQPITPLHLVAHRERSAAYLARFLFIGANFSFLYFTTQYLQAVKGWSPFEAGAAFLPLSLLTFVTGMLASRVASRIGSARLLTGAIALSLLGMGWLSRLTVDTSYLAGIAAPMILIGIAQGFAFGPLTDYGVAGVKTEDAGAASGLVNVAHQLGASLGLSILVTVFAAAGGTLTDPDRLTHGVSAALLGGVVMLLVALVLVTGLILRPGSRRRLAAPSLRPRQHPSTNNPRQKEMLHANH